MMVLMEMTLRRRMTSGLLLISMGLNTILSFRVSTFFRNSCIFLGDMVMAVEEAASTLPHSMRSTRESCITSE